MDAYVALDSVADYPEGKIRRYFLPAAEVAVVMWQGRLYAFRNRCTHADFQLHFGYVEDCLVHCPIHFAAFDMASGEAVSGPYGIDPLPVYPVRVRDGRVEVQLPGSDGRLEHEPPDHTTGEP